MQAPSSKGKI